MQLHENILCVRLDNIGDIIMTSPAFRAIKTTYPRSTITLLTSSGGAKIAPYIPFIDKTLIYDAPWVRNKTHSNFFRTVKVLESRHFDTSLIFTNFSQSSLPSALLCSAAKISQRVGYARENPYDLLTTWIPDTEPFTTLDHGVKRQIRLASAIGAVTKNEELVLFTKKEDQTSLQCKLQRKKIHASKSIIIIHPGVSDKKRQFSVRFFAEVAKKIVNNFDFQVLITGTPSDSSITASIEKSCAGKAISFTNLTIGEYIALLEMSSVVISNNTGSVHIAAAVHTPVVVFYAMTNPEHTPWQVAHKTFYFSIPHNLRSRNQLLASLSYPQPEKFTVDDVVQAVHNLMRNKRAVGDRGIYGTQSI